jgi:hypothetical protein
MPLSIRDERSIENGTRLLEERLNCLSRRGATTVDRLLSAGHTFAFATEGERNEQ